MGRNFRNRQNMRIKSQSNLKSKDTIIKLLVVLILLLLAFMFYYILNNEKQFRENIYTSNTNSEQNVSNDDEIIDENFFEDDFLQSDNDSTNETIDNSTLVEDEETAVTFKLAAVGNIISTTSLNSDVYNSEDNQYDYSFLIDTIQYYTRTADLTVGTLESTLSNTSSNYGDYCFPATFSNTLKKIGFDVISTATDCSLDRDYEGLEETINIIDEADILHTGTNTSTESQNEVVYKYIKGIKIGFISYTYESANQNIPDDKDFSVNLIDEALVKKQVDAAKEAECELIIANVHWGSRSSSDITEEPREITDMMFKNGVDIILGTHPSSVQSFENRTVELDDGTTKNCFVIYSLGDFLNVDATSNMSLILNLNITKELDGTFSIAKPTYTPIYLNTDDSLDSQKMTYLDVETKISEYDVGAGTISESLYNTFISELDKINSILGLE